LVGSSCSKGKAIFAGLELPELKVLKAGLDSLVNLVLVVAILELLLPLVALPFHLSN